MELLHHDDDVRLGNSSDITQVPAQKVHTFKSDSWIALKFSEVFLKAVFHGVVWNRYSKMAMYDQAISLTRPEYRLKRLRTLDPTIGSRSNFKTSFRRLFSIERYHWLKMSITLILTVGSRSNSLRSFRTLFSME